MDIGMKKNKGVIKLCVYTAIFLICLLSGFGGVLSNNLMRYLFKIFLYITLGEMWNLMSGFAGMTSLGQQAFIGLAGYSVAVMTTVYKLNFYFGIGVGAVVGVLGAALLAVLLLHIGGMYFSIATWVAAEALGTFFSGWKYVGQGAGMNITISPYPKMSELYILALILCAASLGVTYLLLRSDTGLGLTAMRDDISAAASLGVNIEKNKFIVYLTAAFFTSLAGAVFFINKGTIYPDSGFDISWTISMVFIVIIGGAGTMEGPVIGSVIYVLLYEYLAHFPGWSNIILGLISILVILFMPKGIAGFLRNFRK